jgi:hypothetical protein
MSSDDGIYVLQTAGPEYRVAYGQAIDNIYGKFNDQTANWDPNPEALRSFFGSSEVFTDLELALDKATEMSYDHEDLEDGISVITSFKDFSFT